MTCIDSVLYGFNLPLNYFHSLPLNVNKHWLATVHDDSQDRVTNVKIDIFNIIC